METITMTNATQISRVRFARRQANAIRLAVTRGWIQGTTVSAVVSDARGLVAAQDAPVFHVDGFGATAAPKTTALEHMDVVYLRTGEPPV
ncbi:MAG TPA: hypothetical protein VFG97_00915 [Pedococcus sp.]|nr:hypothetical protein [Pedococcus sp.]